LCIREIKSPGSLIVVGAESGVTDNLDIGNIGAAENGAIYMIVATSGHTITIRNLTGTGTQFRNSGGGSRVLNSVYDTYICRYDEGNDELIEILFTSV